MENTPHLFKEIAFVVYPVKNMKAAREFYEGPLGLKVTANWEDKWVEYDIGAGTLAITVADETHKPGVHGPTIGLEVINFETVLAHLKQQSIAPLAPPFDTPVCRGCIIRDPDGNEVILHAKK